MTTTTTATVVKASLDVMQRVASIARQVAAVAAVVVGSLQDAAVIPGHYGWILQAAGAVILAVEHYLSDPSTGNTELANLFKALPELIKGSTQAPSGAGAGPAPASPTAPASAAVAAALHSAADALNTGITSGR